MSYKSRLSAGAAIASVLLLGTAIVPACADEHRNDHRGDANHRGGYGRQGGWGGGTYPAPPVVYGRPAYYPPPVVYGPAVGIVLPGIVIGIQ